MPENETASLNRYGRKSHPVFVMHPALDAHDEAAEN